jgi:hypothetical protein
MNSIEAMLSGDMLTDQDKLRATSDALRGSQNAANLFSMSTIKPIAQAATNRAGQFQRAALRRAVLREAALRRAMDAKKAEDARKAAEAAATLDYQRDRQLQQEKDEAAMQRKLVGTVGAGSATPSNMGKITAKEWQEFQNMAGSVANQRRVYDDMQNLGYDKLSTGPSGVIGETFDDIMKKIPAGQSDTQRKRAEVIRNYNYYVVLEARHKMFGGALTPGEREEWNKADISSRMTPEELKSTIEKRQKILQNATKRWMSGLKPRGFNQDQINSQIDMGTAVYAYDGDINKAREFLGMPPLGGEALEAEKQKLGMVKDVAKENIETKSEVAADRIAPAEVGEPAQEVPKSAINPPSIDEYRNMAPVDKAFFDRFKFTKQDFYAQSPEHQAQALETIPGLRQTLGL